MKSHLSRGMKKSKNLSHGNRKQHMPNQTAHMRTVFSGYMCLISISTKCYSVLFEQSARDLLLSEVSLDTGFLPLRFIWYILRVVVSFCSVKLFPRGYVSKQNCSLTVIHFGCFANKRAFQQFTSVAYSAVMSLRRLWEYLHSLSFWPFLQS